MNKLIGFLTTVVRLQLEHSQTDRRRRPSPPAAREPRMKHLVFLLVLCLSAFAPAAQGGEKYLWAELIAFDNAAADYGVAEYLSRMTVKPKGISFLVFDPELFHSHTDLSEDFEIGDLHCSYYARPWNEERPRQKWTAWQLRGLVAELKKHGVDSYPSFFDMAPGKDDGWVRKFKATRKDVTWLDRHPEVGYRLKGGARATNVNPIEKLADGSDYSDFFVPQMVRFLTDYGFAGFHACDGFGHPRFPLNDLDYSHLFPEAKDRAALCRAHAERHAAFIAKLAAALHAKGLKLYANTSWTRDPFEALYRHGIDYRLMEKAGLDGFMAEASATVLELEGWRFSPVSTLDACHAAFLLTGAAVDTPIIHLACVKDGMEQYNSLRDAPQRVTAEVVLLGNLLRGNRPLAADVLWCLTDGIAREEWRFLDTAWNLAKCPKRADGVRVLVSSRAMDAELEAYAAEGYPSAYTLLAHLIKAGAAVNSAVMVEEAKKDASLPLLILNPGRFPVDELTALSDRTAPVVTFGFGARGCTFGEKPSVLEAKSWLYPLPFRPFDPQALSAAAAAINRVSPVFPGEGMADLRLTSYVAEDGSRLVFAVNDRPTYLNAKILVRGPVAEAKALTASPSLPVDVAPKPDGLTSLTAKIPPAGIVVLRLK